MPIYEYACPQCQTTFEEWLKSDDDNASHPCPRCGSVAPRVISNTTFILKGGGWYVTEYGNANKDDTVASTSEGTETPKPAEASSGEATAATPAKESSTGAAPVAPSVKEAAPASAAKPSPSSSPAPAASA